MSTQSNNAPPRPKRLHDLHPTDTEGHSLECARCGRYTNVFLDDGVEKEPCQCELIEKDLMEAYDEGYHIVHCISLDCACGEWKGKVYPCVARTIDARLGIKKQLLALKVPQKKHVGDCVLVGRVFNLITKQYHWQKPTMKTLERALIQLCDTAQTMGLTRLAMPLLGAGMDRLPAVGVVDLISKTFAAANIDVVVCLIRKNK